MSDVQIAAPEVQAPAATAAPAVNLTPSLKPGKPAALGGSPVTAIKPEGANSVIRMYESGTHGYIVLGQQVLDLSNPAWPRLKKRSTLMKGTREILDYIVDHLIDKKTLAMKGKLIVEEVLYDDAFQAEVEAARDKATYVKGAYADYVSQLNLKEGVDEDTMLKGVLKRAGGQDAPILTQHIDGEDVYILKFTRYQEAVNPATGQFDADVYVQHDNYAEIAEYRADNPNDKPE